MSPTVRAMNRGRYRPSPRERQRFDHVARDHAVDAALARRVDARARVEPHARAGVRAAGEKGVDGVIARDVIEALPYAW